VEHPGEQLHVRVYVGEHHDVDRALAGRPEGGVEVIVELRDEVVGIGRAARHLDDQRGRAPGLGQHLDGRGRHDHAVERGRKRLVADRRG
jgi:hypothetical protein